MDIDPYALFVAITGDLVESLPGSIGRDFQDVEKDIEAWPGITARQFACLQLRKSILKKFEDEPLDSADELALEKFLASNDRCKDFVFSTDGCSELEALACGETNAQFYSVFRLPEEESILSWRAVLSKMDVGPGSSRGATGTSWYHKVASSRLTCTSAYLYRAYGLWMGSTPLEADVEENRRRLFGEVSIIDSNRLSFVPKTTKISRTICTEPSVNMLVQKGVGYWLERALEDVFGINLEVQQQKNQKLAWKGSLTGDYGTIDLSSASDSVSLGLLEKIAPADILGWLKLIRSPFTELPDGSKVPLHMVSSMGNATTFPLQTILFASIVVGCYRALGLSIQYPRGREIGNFAVFGDDIIVRREAYNLVVSTLVRYGFVVNETKSFNDGAFRESCGADYYYGYNVRGVYCASLKQPQDLYSLINRLNVWSANHYVPLRSTLKLLLSRVHWIPVPPWEGDTAGVKVPWRLVAKRPWKVDRGTGSILYSCFMPRSTSLDVSDVESSLNDPTSGRYWKEDERRKWGRAKLNPAGIIAAAISGTLRDGRLLFGMKSVRYEKRIRIAPCWDYVDASASPFRGPGWLQWLNTEVATFKT